MHIIHIKRSSREKILVHISLLSLFLQDVHVGNLKVNSKYRVSVGAYGWAGEGRPSMPRDVSTASHGQSLFVETEFFTNWLTLSSPLQFDHSLTWAFWSAISDQCMPPSPPTQPAVMAVSDTELALSWQQGESEGSAPVLHFLVAYIRSVPISWAATCWFNCSNPLPNTCWVLSWRSTGSDPCRLIFCSCIITSQSKICFFLMNFTILLVSNVPKS